MKKMFILIVFTVFYSIVISSCDDNNLSSDPVDLIGTWTRVITDSQGITFDADLVFSANSFDFIVGENVPGHNDSNGDYIIENGMIKIEDTDCIGDIGFYNYSIQATMLTLTVFEDLCEGRAVALDGVWIKKDYLIK